jgi:SAM-dependent methyltransferase
MLQGAILILFKSDLLCRAMMILIYYVAVFLGSFLLFMIQPMLAKALLPAFGGSYLVWGAAMVFFQSVLLGGYLLSHVLQGRLGVRRYARWHLLLLFLPFLFFPFRFDWDVDPVSTGLVLGVCQRLFVVAGLPFLILSMTSMILQRWLMISSLQQRTNPYVLYAASNTGSVLSLLAYPFLVEPWSTLEQQAMGWWIAYGFLVVLHLVLFPRRGGAPLGDERVMGGDIRWRDRWRWLLLSLASGAALLGITNVITFDIASIPLLWVVPLALFMLAYVVTFKLKMWCPGWMEQGLSWCVLAGACLFMLMRLRIMPPVGVVLVVHLATLFCLCVNCNVWLVRTKPASGEGLTAFYVMIATGGLLGSLLVSWVIPLLSHSLLEYPLGFLLVLLAVGSGMGRAGAWLSRRFAGFLLLVLMLLVVAPRCLPASMPGNILFVLLALPVALGFRACKDHHLRAALLLLVLIVGSGGLDRFADGGKVVARLRNYYGIYHIYDRDGIRYLQHGTTQHGRQYLEEPMRSIPLSYFHPSTPAAELLERKRAAIRDIGMIGLGSGALVAYAGEGQQFTVYELDPDNLTLAEQYFGYLEQARRQGAVLRFVFGDGRLWVAELAPASLDVLIMDAFNSGSIPVHLLTTEAFDIFMRALRPDGVLLLHLSNRVLDLPPVIYANAAARGLYAVELSNDGKPGQHH